MSYNNNFGFFPPHSNSRVLWLPPSVLKWNPQSTQWGLESKSNCNWPQKAHRHKVENLNSLGLSLFCLQSVRLRGTSWGIEVIRLTHNGEPFDSCSHCRAQLRLGLGVFDHYRMKLLLIAFLSYLLNISAGRTVSIDVFSSIDNSLSLMLLSKFIGSSRLWIFGWRKRGSKQSTKCSHYHIVNHKLIRNVFSKIR